MRLLAATAAALLLATSFATQAATPKGRTYALVSAVGSSFSLVRQKKQTGSHLDGYQRFEQPIPGVGLDAAVLRGLERIVLEEDPEAKFVYLKLNPEELQGMPRYERGARALGKLATVLERMPERKSWDRVLVVTPLYMNSGREKLGDKLHGIGIFVQNTQKLSRTDENYAHHDDDARTLDGRHTRTVDGRFVAPYFYTQVSVLDAATLRVLETSERWDFQKLFDPDSTSLDIELDFPPEKIAPFVERFVEASTALALREVFGTVTVSEPRPIVPKTIK